VLESGRESGIHDGILRFSTPHVQFTDLFDGRKLLIALHGTIRNLRRVALDYYNFPMFYNILRQVDYGTGQSADGCREMWARLVVLLVLVLLAAAQPAAAEIYGYMDQDRDLYYTDKPIDDSAYKPVNSAARAARLRKRSSGQRVTDADRKLVNQLIEKWAPFYTLDPNLVKAVVEVESAYRIRARSSANAQGLMQLIPATAERFGVGDPWNAEQNLRGGMAYLQVLLSQFKGDLRLVLAAYNAGENNVIKHEGVPPFKEARNYLAKVSRLYGKRWHAYTRREL